MSVVDATAKLKEALTDEEYSSAEVQCLTLRDAEQLLSRFDLVYPLHALERAVAAAKRDATKKQKSGVLRDLVEKFAGSRQALDLRRLENAFCNADLSSSATIIQLLEKSLDRITAAERWFKRNGGGLSLTNTVLSAIEQHFSIGRVINLIDRCVQYTTFEVARDAVGRLKKIELLNARYGVVFAQRENLASVGLKLKATLDQEPRDFVSQVEYGRHVIPDVFSTVFVDRDTLFRDWMRKFSDCGLVEQMKVSGQIQFRSKLKVNHAPNQ